MQVGIVRVIPITYLSCHTKNLRKLSVASQVRLSESISLLTMEEIMNKPMKGRVNCVAASVGSIELQKLRSACTTLVLTFAMVMPITFAGPRVRRYEYSIGELT